MMSRSEDGSDDGRKSPEQTLPSSKEGVVPESALTSATLNNATVSKEPERALRSQTQRAAKLGGGASGGARHVQSSTTFDRVKAEEASAFRDGRRGGCRPQPHNRTAPKINPPQADGRASPLRLNKHDKTSIGCSGDARHETTVGSVASEGGGSSPRACGITTDAAQQAAAA
jgi:hypothetical protein